MPQPVDEGLGAALAQALEGDLHAASAAIRAAVARHGLRPDHVVAWVAVAQAAGRSDEALRLVERLAARNETAPRWLVALHARLSLAQGEVKRAVRLVEGRDDLPPDLVVAAYARAGRWVDAREVWRRAHGRRGDARIAASLDAGVAAERWTSDPPRAARRALKRALAQSPPPLAALVVAAAVAADDDERGRWAQALEARLLAGGTSEVPSNISPGVQVSRRAQALLDQGQTEAALGALRSHLDDWPEDEALRAEYALLLCEHGEPADWRGELRAWAERSRPKRAVGFACAACGQVADAPWVVCPRCDALDTLHAVAAEGRTLGRPGRGGAVADLQALAMRQQGPGPG